MAGWSHDKRTRIESAFYKYLAKSYINSKDAGQVCLGESLYEGQRKLITEIFDALEADIHKIFVLKSRQLGISTIIRALTIFLLGVHKGLKGAICFDTDNNKNEARAELETMINDLPSSLKFPEIKGNNRTGLTLANDSKILFMSAGVRKSKTGGTLGRSVGLTIAHLSELCSYDNDEGLTAFDESLSEIHPDRLYIYESTARGFNKWNLLWKEARKDPHHCRCIFLGWYVKDSQRILRGTVDFTLYGEAPPTPDEAEKITLVKDMYGYEITDEQLAWVRRKYDPAATSDNPDSNNDEDDPVQIQEQPWCVVAGTRVGTDRGIVPIEEAMHARWCSRGRITAGGPTGFAKIWKAKTKLGYELRGTGNHPLITVAGEQVDLSESIGARIKLQPPMLSTSKNLYEVVWQEGAISSRVVITPDMARFVGLFMGDGSASGKFRATETEVSICCTAKDTDVVIECKRLFKDVFNVEATLGGQDGWVTVRSGQRHIFRTLVNLGLTRNDSVKTMRKVHVPDFIWKSSKPVVREFLRGLFEADGYNAWETYRVALFSKYPDFIKDIQLLLLAFGITSRGVSMKKKNGDGRIFTGNQLELRTAEAIKFNLEVGFLSARKQNRFDPIAYEKKWTTPRRGNSKRPVILFEDEIVSVVDEQVTEQVWNLSVEGEHLFDANGILTHNTEDEAFQQTGSIFFPAKQLTAQTTSWVSDKYQRWMFMAGAEFTDMKIYAAPTLKMTDLKVWEEPDVDGNYIIAVDPAFGENPDNDRSAIQVGRCYSDGIDQVAEYASPLVNTRQLAWVIASLLGWYGSGNATVRYIMELNGPGTAVLNAIKELRAQLDNAYFGQAADEKGLKDVFRNVRTYIYSRPDGFGGGASIHFKTTNALKVMIMERLRDFVSNGAFRIRSNALVDEMKTVARDGDSISAPQNMRDDLTLASAFMTHHWETSVRKDLMARRITRASEEARKRLSIVDQVKLFNQSQLGYFFQRKAAGRQQLARANFRQRYRHGR